MRFLLFSLFASLSSLLLLLLLAGSSLAIDNGLGLKPPMGWRSWNLYADHVNQELLQSIMDGMVDRKRLVDGVPTSLCDIGYCDVGLDDAWQLCGSYGPEQFTFHTEAGYPVVDQSKFPDMKAMTDYAHSKGLTAGWYLNNCICQDHCGSYNDQGDAITKCYMGDVGALYEFGFDGVKLDGCSKQRSLDVWAKYINGTGKPMVIENCHWGQTIPNATWCPFNFYRTSNDIVANFGSVLWNLLTVFPVANNGLSYPGCYAYPDMLEVGVTHGPHGASDSGLSPAETRSHFGAWCIVSSPLTLSHDIHNDTVVDQIWDVITNREAIAINQAWAGHSGSAFTSSSRKVTKRFKDAHGIDQSVTVGSHEYLYKPLSTDGTYFAILLMNLDTVTQDLSFNFTDVPKIACSTVLVHDVWKKSDIGKYTNSYTAKGMITHDSAFLTIKCMNEKKEETAIY